MQHYWANYNNLIIIFQSFLGMVQLEYQARVDMVQLIDLLEKACIRFALFPAPYCAHVV